MDSLYNTPPCFRYRFTRFYWFHLTRHFYRFDCVCFVGSVFTSWVWFWSGLRTTAAAQPWRSSTSRSPPWFMTRSMLLMIFMCKYQENLSSRCQNGTFSGSKVKAFWESSVHSLFYSLFNISLYLNGGPTLQQMVHEWNTQYCSCESYTTLPSVWYPNRMFIMLYFNSNDTWWQKSNIHRDPSFSWQCTFLQIKCYPTKF